MSSRLDELFPAWMRRAACSQMDTETFFPAKDDGPSWKAAKDTCQRCPVRQECLEYAIRNHIHQGIWGGMGPKSRKAYARREYVNSLMVR